MGAFSKNRFTTSQAADLCGVSVRTLKRWLERGELTGYRLPMSGEWRIPRQELVAFMEHHGMPLGELEAETRRRILVVASEPATFNNIKGTLSADFRLDVERAADGLEACLKFGHSPPHIVIIDLTIPGLDGFKLAQTILDHASPQQAKVVFLADAADAGSAARAKTLRHALLPHPVEAETLFKVIYSLVGMSRPGYEASRF
jgi:excisionase family DNA binding protein